MAFSGDKGDVVNKNMLFDLAKELVEKPFERLTDNSRLTGEWIIFSIYNNEKYYLSIDSHKSGDDTIVNNIKEVCCREFVWLQKLMDN